MDAGAGKMVIVRLNARLQPIDRGEWFEDPLAEALESKGYGEVTGGGTMQDQATGEIQFCDIELTVPSASPEVLAFVTGTLDELGAPKGSTLTVEGSDAEHRFGRAEGLAVYLNGTDLPDETYRSCDVNFVVSECGRLLEGEARVLSHWEGPSETSLYMYGTTFEGMSARLRAFFDSYPLCQKCRVVQVA
jgi:hypothetical protein